MPNITGVPTGSECTEITTCCTACERQVVVTVEKGSIEQVVGGRVCYGAVTRINEVVMMFDCLSCGAQNDVIA